MLFLIIAFFISGGSLVSWSIVCNSCSPRVLSSYEYSLTGTTEINLYKESPFLHKATGFLRCLQPVTLTQIFPPCAKKYWDMANQLGCFLQKVRVIRLHWNVKLCCLYYFFQNSIFLTGGCGLSMGVAYTQSFTVMYSFYCESWHTVQLRYKRTTHTRIIRAYFAYTRMSIRAHIRVYTRTYTRIYARICLFVMHSHKFLYVKHC